MAPKPLQPQPDPQEDSILLQKFAGIKNVVDADRLGPDELEKAVNIDLDDVGRIHRRRGWRQFGTWTMPCHSVYATQDGRTFVAAKLSNVWTLTQVMPDGVRQGINSAPATADPISYVQIDHKLYYSSRAVNGIIDLSAPDPTYGPLGGPDVFISPVINPTATLAPIRGRLLTKPPLAPYIAYSNGRMYYAEGRNVWFSELFDFTHLERVRNFWQFEADITMLAAVTDDLYVGTAEGVYYVSGTAVQPKRVRVMDSGAIPGSLVIVPAEIGNPALGERGIIAGQANTDVKVSIMFMTHKGLCGGQDGGVCYNFTESKVIFPGAESAAAFFRQQDGVNQYVAALNSGGSPSANTRLGDYVDAEIRRGGASWNTLSDGVKVGDRFTVYKNGVLSP